MKVGKGIIIYIIVLTLLAVPVIAAKATTDGGEGLSYPRADLDTVPGLAGFNPNSYFYEFNHGADCITELPNSGVSSASTAGWGHTTILKNSGATWVDCPLQTIASITGHHPYIRYGLVQFASQSDKAKIMQIDFYNGRTLKKSWTNINGYSTNGEAKELTWDFGDWYQFDRGMNLVFLTRNDNTVSSQWILISGYGARQDYIA